MIYQISMLCDLIVFFFFFFLSAVMLEFYGIHVVKKKIILGKNLEFL
jgi:hypothetical protein